MWIGLEINLLSIIPLITNKNNIFSSESALKYFITQALASRTVLFSIIIIRNSNEFIPQNSENFFIIIINSALLIKLGAAPFHSWFPEVMEGLNWINCLIILTWQKIAPIILIIYNIQITLFFTTVIIASTIIGGLIGINQTRLRKIIAYSSINHIGWIIARIYSFSIWRRYFLIYCLISFNIIIIFKINNLFWIRQVSWILKQRKSFKIIFILNFLSLGGIPPFIGFFPKWITINRMVSKNFYFLRVILIIFTLVTLFLYLRITFSAITINSEETLIFKRKINNFMINLINLVSLLGLRICTILFNLF